MSGGPKGGLLASPVLTSILASAVPWTVGLQVPAILTGWILGGLAVILLGVALVRTGTRRRARKESLIPAPDVTGRPVLKSTTNEKRVGKGERPGLGVSPRT